MALGCCTVWKSLTISWSFGGRSEMGWRENEGGQDEDAGGGGEERGLVGSLSIEIDLKNERVLNIGEVGRRRRRECENLA